MILLLLLLLLFLRSKSETKLGKTLCVRLYLSVYSEIQLCMQYHNQALAWLVMCHNALAPARKPRLPKDVCYALSSYVGR